MKNSTEVEWVSMYLNRMQMLATIVDPKILIIEAGRAAGKTEGGIGPRTIRVAADLPRETSVLCHKTYVALLSNIVPNLKAYYNEPKLGTDRPLLVEGEDYVMGVKNLPKHFAKPRYPITYPEHTIVYANGHNIRLVSTDQPESIAGGNIVHVFCEEMKHTKGDRFRTRVLPALRVGRLTKGADRIQSSPYYQGITAVSDTARVSLGEDDWFIDYENQVDQELIADIVSLAIHVNEAMYNIQQGKNVSAMQTRLDRCMPILRRMRAAATLYLRVSTFVNKDTLGYDYFKTQLKVLPPDEFITAICSVRERRAKDMFIANFKAEIHTFDDSYKYESIMKLGLQDTFKLTAEYLKYYNPDEPLELGYDPGHFASLVCAQPKKANNEYRILKEFYTYSPEDIPDLARKFADFFSCKRNRLIYLYHDRAGNQKKGKRANETDARELKAELEKRGFRVQLKNETQRTIMHWEHYKLNLRLFVPNSKHIPKILIDSNECPNLISSIYCAPIKVGSNPIELDKSSENLPLHLQAGLSTQIMTSMLYLLFGKFERFMERDTGPGGGMPLSIG